MDTDWSTVYAAIAGGASSGEGMDTVMVDTDAVVVSPSRLEKVPRELEGARDPGAVTRTP
jgi:hypothetical protein